jgi:protein-S-isoprenylcysteine O-methyltransferase Ste14
MRGGKLNISPDLKDGATIIREGPYKWIRHPMYLAVLTVMLGITLVDPNPARWILLIVLTINLVVKMHHEEKLLQARFKEYPGYQKSTKRILPFVY